MVWYYPPGRHVNAKNNKKGSPPAQKILAVQTITPKDLEITYGFTGGHPFHGELALDQIFTMRPLLGWARYATPIAGLFLCGNGTHPGNGLTGASGHNAAREILKHLRK